MEGLSRCNLTPKPQPITPSHLLRPFHQSHVNHSNNASFRTTASPAPFSPLPDRKKRPKKSHGKEIETDMSLQKMDNKSLIAMLHQHLHCMRCFIVFDDMMPDDSYMQNVFKSLPKENGSRLLFTTRDPLSSLSPSDELALALGAFLNHKMKFLDDDKSWELLLKTLFFGTGEKKFPKHLEEKGKRVLKKCNGFPLAIKEVGRQWAEMIGSGSKWDEVVESVDLSASLEVLNRSYKSWSDDIKACCWIFWT